MRAAVGISVRHSSFKGRNHARPPVRHPCPLGCAMRPLPAIYRPRPALASGPGRSIASKSPANRQRGRSGQGVAPLRPAFFRFNCLCDVGCAFPRFARAARAWGQSPSQFFSVDRATHTCTDKPASLDRERFLRRTVWRTRLRGRLCPPIGYRSVASYSKTGVCPGVLVFGQRHRVKYLYRSEAAFDIAGP
ncbi:unnamed protein product [Amoebophrya sp. A120]|nr:unnamed protein product [Amoebophrya sp. A120]|eukprot:GSA120T00019153001.1